MSKKNTKKKSKSSALREELIEYVTNYQAEMFSQYRQHELLELLVEYFKDGLKGYDQMTDRELLKTVYSECNLDDEDLSEEDHDEELLRLYKEFEAEICIEEALS